MPRRNRRETFEPLDLTPVDLPLPKPARGETWRDRELREAELRRRQRDARLNGGIDWEICLVPGCGWIALDAGKPRNHTIRLPLCLDHLATAHAQATYRRDDPLMVEAALLAVKRQADQQASLDEAAKKAWLAKTTGHMYFVRLNDLIKVGWTRDLRDRLKAYGASAEVLVHYPATRDDETLLHRQLRPVLAKGREWYTDGPVVQRFITQALAEHGPPTITATWTEPRKVVAGKRHR